MKFPVKVSYRKAEAKIYGKSAAYPFYGISYRAAGKRHVRSFSSYNEAKVEAETKVRKIANGNQTTASNTFWAQPYSTYDDYCALYRSA